MRHARLTKSCLASLLAFCGLMSSGCTHNYYYPTPGSGSGPCVPMTVLPGATASNVPSYGEICEVPTQVVGGGTVLAGTPLTTTPVLVGARPPRVVLSDPAGRGRGPWRRTDPESSLATTRVEGALDDPTLTR